MARIRTPKNFVLEERLERYAAGIEQHPEELAGRWHESHAASKDVPYERVHLDLGCGKGSYICDRAALEPHTLFVGVDQEPICVAYAAQTVVESGLSNVIVVCAEADALGQIFAAGEVDALTLNFPTPHPKRRHAEERLVHVNRLFAFRSLLSVDGTVTLRTDSKPLRDFALGQFEAAGYRALWTSDNVRAEHPEHPETDYELRTREMGASVYGICAALDGEPTAEQVECGRAQEQSLVCYLPDDLDSIGYVPLGMEATVINLKNRARKGKPTLP